MAGEREGFWSTGTEYIRVFIENLVLAHSRLQRLRSIWPAPWIETSGRLQFSVRDSRTSGRSAQSHAFIKMMDQARIDLFHEALNFGLEILNFSDITLG